jgi:sugar phosphate isomerase/epimerase
MKLGMDTFSLGWQGWDAFGFLEYAAKLGLDNVQFSERRFLASLSEDYLKSLKQRAEELGLTVEIGMMSFDKYSRRFNPELGSGEQQLIDMVRAAKHVGSPIVRCLLGGWADRLGPVPFEQHVEECIRTLKAVAPVARDLGIRFAMENHDGVDLLARELCAVIEKVGPEVVGVCLDTGNPVYAGEDPVLSAEVLGSYVISSHVRDSRVWSVADGAMAQWVPVGQGCVDLGRIVQVLAERAPHAPINLEIITGSASGSRHIPYLDPESDYWKLYPNMLARDFARFIALAQSGSPEPLNQVTPPRGTRGLPQGELGEQLKAQQLRHFEESVTYCREVLGFSTRGRAA